MYIIYANTHTQIWISPVHFQTTPQLLYNNTFTNHTRRLHRSLLTNICTHGCNNFSRFITALHSKSESVSFIVLTANLSMELGHFSTISNTTLLSLSVLGDAVPPTKSTTVDIFCSPLTTSVCTTHLPFPKHVLSEIRGCSSSDRRHLSDARKCESCRILTENHCEFYFFKARNQS